MKETVRKLGIEQRLRAASLSERIHEDPKTARELGIRLKETLSKARDEQANPMGREGTETCPEP